ncbi:acyl-coenzyme A:6-aminopenicillanic acid acyl-transferase-domain-containing protein [Schizophyllum amplum]|uniref:Acyl-coenzyme A:6-aminopenicillanic acid acyl-transferase-domain-containing protein n=1 Tax=Schizophyllum amplum TaxID=97359 RepID=A0A550C6W2_9AGAR|nr:acyl-coenzyme A:6-aminopenicillanic acid acyl-transferase-domain-containing protein [Auriculariopsis ampla]
MLVVHCSGTPREIGLAHGTAASSQVAACFAFYAEFFERTAMLKWDAVCEEAAKFLPYLESKWAPYVEEMKGLAEGAGQPFLAILALNVRTEIAYGMAKKAESDGCTALSYFGDGSAFIAQNWDWLPSQKANLVLCHIAQSGKPSISMITEAGIIGKIGLNDRGVGVTLNAIRATGVRFDALPTHLALRTVLESESRAAAVERLEGAGVAAACHIIIADATAPAVGLECSVADIVRIEDNGGSGCVVHTNHFLQPHVGRTDPAILWQDSVPRLERITTLLKERKVTKMEDIEPMLEDEEGYPTSICREVSGEYSSATLFSIVMDLKGAEARVREGRPIIAEGVLSLKPGTAVLA